VNHFYVAVACTLRNVDRHGVRKGPVAALAIGGEHVRRPIVRIRQRHLQQDLRRFAIARVSDK
jgi:hypothetical protein